MTLIQIFIDSYDKKFSGIWRHRLELIRSLVDSSIDSELPTVEHDFRVSSAFRQISFKAIPGAISYEAIETELGARAQCCAKSEVKGERGTIAAENAFQFAIQYLSGASLESVQVERNKDKRSCPARSVLVCQALSDEVWKILTMRGIALPAIVCLFPTWMDLPLRVFNEERVPVEITAQDPSISFTGEQRGIGFIRINTRIQYSFYEEREPQFADNLKLAGSNRALSESGFVSSAEIAVDLAIEWLNGAQHAELKTVRQIIRCI